MNYHPSLAPPITIDRSIITITQDFLAGYLLNYVYQKLEDLDENDEWVKTSGETVSREMMLTPEQISTATAKLIELQLIGIRVVMEGDRVIETWYRPNFEVVDGLLCDLIKKHTQARKI